MAYIPPHKRHQSKDENRPAPTPSPVPASLIPHFKQSLTVGPSRRRKDRRGGSKILYAAGCISRWWPVGSASGDDPIPASFRLESFDCEIVERRYGEKPLILVGGGDSEKNTVDARDPDPWVSIAERIEPDLITAAKCARTEAASDGDEKVKLALVVRFGKNFFHGDCRGSSVCLDTIRKAAAAAWSDTRDSLHKSFYTNIPDAYMANTRNSIAPGLGFEFQSEKEHYHVKVSDKSRPNSTISCKCIITERGQLEIYKIELNPVRNLVADISCMYKDLDLRLLLVTKRLLKNIDKQENDGLNKLVRSAVIDPDVKGGLRWPIGKEFVDDRFSIVGAWHTKFVALKSDTMRLKLRWADRFDHTTSMGEISSDVSLKLSEITRHLEVSYIL
ncbi:hypothetical protein AXF42_Ash020244 [Apostasia shenzhenica]|uniref:DUF7903 domain-containing protein n=1 Tax=Apostasia shenzhenica TaxID=1088818 RepID=A0A2I0AVS5_9ASPA|nr:hypothetical protein AXF42_Ash020244 [Apostasia shenzhenica]